MLTNNSNPLKTISHRRSLSVSVLLLIMLPLFQNFIASNPPGRYSPQADQLISDTIRNNQSRTLNDEELKHRKYRTSFASVDKTVQEMVNVSVIFPQLLNRQIIKDVAISGACPGREQDQTPDLQKAMDSAAFLSATSLPTTLIRITLGKGCFYYLRQPRNAAPFLKMSNAHDVEIDGNGSTLVFVNTVDPGILAQNPASLKFSNGLVIEGSERVNIHNLSTKFISPTLGPLDTNPNWEDRLLHYSVGVIHKNVIGINEILLEPRFENNFDSTYKDIGLIDSENHFLVRADSVFVYSGDIDFLKTRRDGKGLWVSSHLSRLQNFHEGDRVLVAHGKHGGETSIIVQPSAVRAASDISFEKINIINGSGVSLNIKVAQGFLLANSSISPEYGGLFATTGGLFSGKDIVIRDSTFMYNSDDPINIKAQSSTVTSATTTDGNQSTLRLQGAVLVSKGDILCIHDSMLYPVFCAPVFKNSSGMDIVVEGTYNFEPGDGAYNLTAMPSRVYIARNTIIDSRARGILMKTSNALVVGNKLSRIVGNDGAISLKSTRTVWTEFAPSHNVRIVNNVVDGAVGYGIDVSSIIGTEVTDYSINRDILVATNIVLNSTTQGYHFASFAGLDFYGNIAGSDMNSGAVDYENGCGVNTTSAQNEVFNWTVSPPQIPKCP